MRNYVGACEQGTVYQTSGSYIQCSTVSSIDFCRYMFPVGTLFVTWLWYTWAWSKLGVIVRHIFLSIRIKKTLNDYCLKTSLSLVMGEDLILAVFILNLFPSVPGLQFALASPNYNPAPFCSFHSGYTTDSFTDNTLELQHRRNHLLSINTARIKVTIALDIDWAFVFFNACII